VILQSRRFALVALVALTLVGCGAPPSDAVLAPQPGVAAQAWRGGTVDITVGGVVDHRVPIPHEVARAWLPVVAAADEGERLDMDETIVRVDVEVAERWRDGELRGSAEREAGATRSRLQGEGTISGLRERIADLNGRIAVAEAAVAATRSRDQEEIAIARREFEAAQSRLRRARAEYERLTALVAANAATARDLARATNDFALAQAELAAPQLTLDILEQTTYAIERRRRELERDRLIAERIGVETELAARADGEQRAGHIDNRDVERRRLAIADFEAVIANPEVRASAGGVLRYQPGGIGIGSKPGWTPFAFMLDPAGLVVVATVSDRWRPWLTASEAATVTIELPALGRTLPGRVAAIAAQPETAADGTGAVFRVQIEPLEGRDLLLPGSRAICRISLDTGMEVPLAVVPAWMIADRRQPQVTLTDGTVRDLEGLLIGHEFLVLSGLAPGERVMAATPAAGRGERVVAGVEPVRFHPIRSGGTSRRDGWRVRWLIPDGSQVAAGDPVAGLTYAGWGDPSERRFEIAYAELEAESRLARERSDVAATIGKAAAMWRQAVVDADRARFEVLIINLPTEDPTVLAREAAVVRAENALRLAQANLADLLVPAAADAISANEAEGRRIASEQAELSLIGARLAEVAARRRESFIARLTTIAADRDAQAELARLREAYVTARLSGQARLARSAYDYRQAIDRVKRDQRRISGEELLAPVAGVVYQRARPDGRLLVPGDWLDISEPLIMPIGNERKAVFECADHQIAGLREGDDLTLIVPALGGRVITGRISQIGRALVPSRRNRGEDVADVRVVLVTVIFHLDDETLTRLPLGSTVYADL